MRLFFGKAPSGVILGYIIFGTEYENGFAKKQNDDLYKSAISD
jgi:hypothetical protein